MSNELAGLKGGPKRVWLEKNRYFILQYFDMFGEKQTKTRFHLTHDTLERLIEHEPRTLRPNFSLADKAVAKADIAIEAVYEMREELRRLEDLFGQFVNCTAEQVKIGLLVPLLENLIQFSGNLPEKPDPLSIKSLFTETPMLKTAKEINHQLKKSRQSEKQTPRNDKRYPKGHNPDGRCTSHIVRRVIKAELESTLIDQVHVKRAKEFLKQTG